MLFIFHSSSPVNCSYQLEGRAAVDEIIYKNITKKCKSAKIIIRLLVFNRILKMLRKSEKYFFLKNVIGKTIFYKENTSWILISDLNFARDN